MSPKKVGKAAAKAGKSPKSAKKEKKAAAPPPESSSEDDSSEEEEEATAAVEAKLKAKKVPNGAVKAEESDSEEESSDDSEEEAPAKPAKATNGKAKKAAAKEESSEEEESSDDDEEEEKPAPKKQAAKKEESSEEEDDDEDDDDDESEEEEMEVEETKSKKKRKADTAEEVAPKKAKVEEKTTIFIRGAADDVEDKKIAKFLKKNDIETTEIRRGKPGKNMAWADLANPEDLDKALALSGQELKGNELTIEKARTLVPREEFEKQRQQQQAGGGGGKDSNVMFVKGLPYSTTEKEVKAFFPGANEVRMPKRDDGQIKGFAFIEFATEAEVEKMIEEKQGAEMGGMSLLLDFSGSKSQKPKFDGGRGGGGGRSSAEPGKTKVLFVKNLSYDSTEDSLKEAFEGASSARIATFQDSGRSRGFGFVEFDSAEDAKSAFDAMQGESVDGRQVTIDFAAERDGGGRGGGRGGFGGRGGRGGGGRGGGFGGRGGRGGGGFGGRGGRGGRGGGRGGRGGFQKKEGIRDFAGSKKTFDD